MALTDAAIRAAKPQGRKYKLADGGGLQLHVTQTGSRLWRFAYRFGGKQRELSIGQYPVVSLADARLARDAAKKKLAAALDPCQQKRLAKLTRQSATTFKAAGEEYREKMIREGKAEQTVSKFKWILEDLIYPFIGERPIAGITAPELLAVLRRVESRGHYETAARARRICGQIFRYAIATGRAERDIAHDLRGALTVPKYKPRPAILDPQGIGALLRAIEGYEGQGITLYALKLAPLVFVRPGELRTAEWAEFDLENALWRIPAAKMKMRKEHLVPLSRQVLDILRFIHRLTGHGKYVFPSAWGARRPISENTINGALRRMGFAKDQMCAHGFRRMASTQLHESGFNTEWVERQLAHVDSNSIRGIYNAAQYLEGRKNMMQWWADRLDQLRAEKS